MGGLGVHEGAWAGLGDSREGLGGPCGGLGVSLEVPWGGLGGPWGCPGRVLGSLLDVLGGLWGAVEGPWGPFLLP